MRCWPSWLYYINLVHHILWMKWNGPLWLKEYLSSTNYDCNKPNPSGMQPWNSYLGPIFLFLAYITFLKNVTLILHFPMCLHGLLFFPHEMPTKFTQSIYLWIFTKTLVSHFLTSLASSCAYIYFYILADYKISERNMLQPIQI